MTHGSAQWRTTLRIGGVLFLVGAVCNVAMFATNAYPTFLYFLLMGFGLCAMCLGLWARRNWIARDRAPGPVRQNVLFVLGLLTAVLLVAWHGLVGVDYYVDRTMTWERVEGGEPNHVVLRFTDYPGYYVGLYSAEIEGYLAGLDASEVSVTFRVTPYFGNVRSQDLVRVGAMDRLESVGAYSALSGPYTASPWEDHRGD